MVAAATWTTDLPAKDEGYQLLSSNSDHGSPPVTRVMKSSATWQASRDPFEIISLTRDVGRFPRSSSKISFLGLKDCGVDASIKQAENIRMSFAFPCYLFFFLFPILLLISIEAEIPSFTCPRIILGCTRRGTPPNFVHRRIPHSSIRDKKKREETCLQWSCVPIKRNSDVREYTSCSGLLNLAK